MKKKSLKTGLVVMAVAVSLVASTAGVLTAAEKTTDSKAPKLTVEDAKKAAFDDAGVTEKDVVLKKAGLTKDDGVSEYEVEFYYADTEYSYDIDPDSGKITDKEQDPMDAEDQAEMKALQENAAKKPGDKKKNLKVDDAKKIAFSDAGVKEKDAVVKRAGLTTDDGVAEYEVEFYYKDFEYSYDIDPNTGVITDFEKEAMDEDDKANMKSLQEKAKKKKSDKNGELTVDDAKKIAFDDAGVKEKDVVLKKAELTTDDGVDEFDVEFYYKDVEYSYDIDAKTGIITDLDRDPMDAEDQAEMEALKNKSSGKSSAKSGSAVNEDKAFEIAVSDAGLSADQVTGKKVKLDFDDDYGKEIYDVEFRNGSTEYNYDIDPETGAILKEESDIDD